MRRYAPALVLLALGAWLWHRHTRTPLGFPARATRGPSALGDLLVSFPGDVLYWSLTPDERVLVCAVTRWPPTRRLRSHGSGGLSRINCLAFWSVPQRRLISWARVREQITEMHLAPDGKTLVCAGAARDPAAEGLLPFNSDTLSLWSVPDGKLIRRAAINPGISALYCSPDGVCAVGLGAFDTRTRRADRCVRVWALPSLKLTRMLPHRHVFFGPSLRFSADGRIAAINDEVAPGRMELAIYETRTWRLLRALRPPVWGEYDEVGISPDGRWVVGSRGSTDQGPGDMVVCSVQTGRAAWRLRGYEAGWGACFTPDSRGILFGNGFVDLRENSPRVRQLLVGNDDRYCLGEYPDSPGTAVFARMFRLNDLELWDIRRRPRRRLHLWQGFRTFRYPGRLSPGSPDLWLGADSSLPAAFVRFRPDRTALLVQRSGRTVRLHPVESVACAQPVPTTQGGGAK